MDEVERLFRHLVDILAEQGSERLRSPLQISELYQTVIPYRRYRSALRFDTNQDYEMALLRLLSGEHAYARVEPEEIQEALIAEVQSINPNAGAFRQFAAANVHLDAGAVRTILNARQAFAPPGEESDFEELSDEPQEPSIEAEPVEPKLSDASRTPASASRAEKSVVFEPVVSEIGECRACRRALPSGRTVIYCPFCGQNQQRFDCPDCGTELEGGWKHCITCGRALKEK